MASKELKQFTREEVAQVSVARFTWLARITERRALSVQHNKPDDLVRRVERRPRYPY